MHYREAVAHPHITKFSKYTPLVGITNCICREATLLLFRSLYSETLHFI